MTERMRRGVCAGVGAVLFTSVAFGQAAAPSGSVQGEFKEKIRPLLETYCFDCHGDGASKGNLSLDGVGEGAAGKDAEVWWKVLKNVRTGQMPPPKKKQPSAEEKALLDAWIKRVGLGIDPSNPDPGRVTLRRLNRVEYQNTIRDLMGVEFKAEEEFPPDDTGYGFDTIGDVLSVSPLLLEKYMAAAEQVVNKGVPTTDRTMPEATVFGNEFRGKEPPPSRVTGAGRGNRDSAALSFYAPGALSGVFRAQQAGTYQYTLSLTVRGSFDFDPGRAKVVLKLDGREIKTEDLAWENGKRYDFDFEEKWEPGEKRFTLELTPLVTVEEKKKWQEAQQQGQPQRRQQQPAQATSVDLRINSLVVRGPTEKETWGRPRNFERFFTKDAPGDAEGRRAYAKEVLTKFTGKAFRRPADERVVDKLVKIAEAGWSVEGKTFEQGVGRAMVAVLASPRFLFRIEGEANVAPAPGVAVGHPLIDEYALATRLSYFIWSTMPDDELMSLAAKGELRKNLPSQVARMMADARSEALIENFLGQWLQVRDVEGMNIDVRTVLARDAGIDKELSRITMELQAIRAKREAETSRLIAEGKPVPERQQSPEEAELRTQLLRMRRNTPQLELDSALRAAMQRETEMFFTAIVKENKSLLDLLDANYTYLNEKLAKHYGIPDVRGTEMRRVELPKDSVRGGLLTQGAVLVVTSNPTRTSPVKRGMFVLDNILGAPAPPPPQDVPELEEAEKEFKDKEPSLREVLELHRSNPACASCHDRMDPLGLALENFNALGMYRETERKLPIDPAGRLATGESFKDVRGLKKALRESRRTDFYRCLTEKMMTYALGRGIEHYDVEAVDRIVARLEAKDGKFSELLAGIIESAPFQKRRLMTGSTNATTTTNSNAGRTQ